MKNICRILMIIILILIVSVYNYPQPKKNRLKPLGLSGFIKSKQKITPKFGDNPYTSLQSTPSNIKIGPTKIVSGPQFFSVDNPPYGLLGRDETTIASSSDGNNIVIGWNTSNGFLPQLELQGLAGFTYSNNGGGTFANASYFPSVTYNGGPLVTLGDPWLGSGGRLGETFYFATLSCRPVTQDLRDVGVSVYSGTFNKGILNWSSPSVIAVNEYDFFDKEALAADKTGNTQSVYVSLTNFKNWYHPTIYTEPQIEVYRSSNSGKTWAGPSVVKGPDDAGNQGTDIAVGPKGQVYVAWQQYNFPDEPITTERILFASSKDQGVSFTQPGIAATVNGADFYPPVGYNRTSTDNFPRIAVDLTNRHNGRIYLVYHDVGNNPPIHTDGIFYNINTGETMPTGGVFDSDIYLKYSDDGGLSWSSPVLISSKTPGDGKAQFFPSVSVDKFGKVSVIYYQDTEVQSNPIDPNATNTWTDGYPWYRSSSYQSLVDVCLVQSSDGGSTFSSPVLINNRTSNWSTAWTDEAPNFGDYITCTSAGNTVYASWTQSYPYEVTPGNPQFVPSAAFAKIVSIDEIGKNALAQNSSQPADFNLYDNYPNPFNPSTTIKFDLPQSSPVSLKIYSSQGQEVGTIYNGEILPAGSYQKSFNGSNLASGIYFFQIITNRFQSTKKMMLLK